MKLWIIILISALITFTLRAVPYVFFGTRKEIPLWVDDLGKMLPAAIMATLVVYTLKDVLLFDHTLWALFGGTVATVGTHLWKRMTILSILIGTIVYMLVLRVI